MSETNRGRVWAAAWALVVSLPAATVSAQVEEGLVATATSAATEQPGRTVPEEWTELMARVQARDASAGALYLPYQLVGRRPVGDGAAHDPIADEPLDDSTERYHEQGWWAADETGFAFARDLAGEHGPLQVRVEWDGERCQVLHAQPDLLSGRREAEGVFPALLQVHPHPAVRAVVDAEHMPGEMGLRAGLETWPQLSSAMSDIQVLGRERVAGVDCLKVLYDLTGPGVADDGAYVSPCLVWFDDRESLLAVRRVMFTPVREGDEPVPDLPDLGPALRFGERSFRPFNSRTVTSLRRTGDGVWLPATARLVRRTRQGVDIRELTLGDDGTAGAALPGHCRPLRAPPGTRLIDDISGRNEMLSGEGY